MIPVNVPRLIGREKEYLIECIETGWISSEGPFVTRFENEFSTYIGRKNGIAVANGSAALDVAVRAMNLEKGSEVIVPTFTIISPVQSLVKEGLIPVLVDVDPETFNMDVSAIEDKITDKTAAILVVHIYGFPVDMDPVIELASKYELRIIEDAAEMHGQEYKGRKCGSFGDISVFSFYPNKHITTGEGGMILTDDDDLAERCRQLKNLCFIPARRFVHEEFGWNYRMTNLQAALGVAQLEQIDSVITRKREIGNRYSQNLKGISRVKLPAVKNSYAQNISWVYALVAESEELCDHIQSELKKHKIGTRPFFWCMHEQPVFQKMGFFKNESYPHAEKIARNGFYIPAGLGISDAEIDIVSEKIREIITNG